jgi:hypothetical protein
MHLHLFGVALAAQFATGIFKVANKLLLFCINLNPAV